MQVEKYNYHLPNEEGSILQVLFLWYALNPKTSLTLLLRNL